MKVLLTPLILNENTDGAYFLCKNIASLLNTTANNVAISAPINNKFHHASFFTSPKPSFSLRISNVLENSYEDYLFNKGVTTKKFLEDDLKAVLSAINDFKPDVIVTHDRLSSIIAARLSNIPIYAIVHPSTFIYKNVSSNVLAGINEVLSNNGFEQVFNLEEFYSTADKLFVFGPVETAPFVSYLDVTRIGLQSIYPTETDTTNNIFIYLNNTRKSKRNIKKIIKESFDGAPYTVNASIGDDIEKNINNINFISPKLSLLNSASICIHDGNDYIFNNCLALGIPQLIIAGNDYLRSTNGTKAQRNHFGSCIFEEELSMETLYEAYHRMEINSSYTEAAQLIKASTLQEGDLTKILQFFD